MDGTDLKCLDGSRPVDEERKAQIANLWAPYNALKNKWLLIGLVGILLFFIPTIYALVVGWGECKRLKGEVQAQVDAINRRSAELRKRIRA